MRAAFSCMLLSLGAVACAALSITPGNLVTDIGGKVLVNGKPVHAVYRSSGDVDGDGNREIVLTVHLYGDEGINGFLVVDQVGGRSQVSEWRDPGFYTHRADVTDINGDGKLEIIARGCSDDNYGYCTIYGMRKGRLAALWTFGGTTFRDLSGDGVPEVLSLDHYPGPRMDCDWLTIYKWNGQGYTDVSRRYPREYASVIRNLKREIHGIRYTSQYFDMPLTPRQFPEIFAYLYYHLGLAYEYHREPEKARMQYAIALRLQPDHEESAKAIKSLPPNVNIGMKSPQNR